MSKLGELKCSHGHNWSDHPNCFVKDGKYLLPKRLLEENRYLQWYEKENAKIGFFDIEASDLSSDVGWMISWAMKERGNKQISYDQISQKDVLSRNFDKRIVTSLLDEFTKYDCVVGYYSSGFDLPYIMGRSIEWGLEYPKPNTLFQIDVYFAFKHRIALHRKSLESLTKHFKIAGKTKLDFGYWKLSALGFEKELKEMEKHNKADILILEKLFDEIEPYCRFSKRSV